MTKATPKKKPTVKAHRGFAHVPLRGRRRPPRRRPVGDPPIGQLPRQLPRRRRRPPIQQPIGTPRRPMTPAQRDAMRRQMEAARRRFNQQRRRGQQEAVNPRGRPALPIRRRPTVEQLRDAVSRNARRPQTDPKRRRRVTGTPAKKQVTQARQAPRTRRIRRPV